MYAGGANPNPPPNFAGGVMLMQDGHLPWYQRHRYKVICFTIAWTAIIGFFVAIGVAFIHPPRDNSTDPPYMPSQWKASFYGGYANYNCRFKGWIYYNADLLSYRTDWTFESDLVSDCGQIGSSPGNNTYFARTDITYGNETVTGGGGILTRSYHVGLSGPVGQQNASFTCTPTFLKDVVFWSPDYLRSQYSAYNGEVTFVGYGDADRWITSGLFSNGTVTTYVSKSDGSWLQMDINGGAGTDWNGAVSQKYTIVFGDGGLVPSVVPAAVFEPLPIACGH